MIFDNGAHRRHIALNFSRVIEVNRQTKKIVWEYINPHFASRNIPGEKSLVTSGEQNTVFRAFRYAPEEVPWLEEKAREQGEQGEQGIRRITMPNALYQFCMKMRQTK
ncbi:hypothetical protein [Nostoc sp.]|uniref:hypothetical protein n=1 Tax=Nostoc sp. TaxID=1180 RepID=UPI002FF55BFF